MHLVYRSRPSDYFRLALERALTWLVVYFSRSVSDENNSFSTFWLKIFFDINKALIKYSQNHKYLEEVPFLGKYFFRNGFSKLNEEHKMTLFDIIFLASVGNVDTGGVL